MAPSERAARSAAALAGIGVLFLVAVAATIYESAGGMEWGGRFLSPLTALVATGATVGILAAIAGTPPPARRRFVAIAVALAVLPAIGGWQHLRSYRALAADAAAEVRAVGQGEGGIVVTSFDLLSETLWRPGDGLVWLGPGTHATAAAGPGATAAAAGADADAAEPEPAADPADPARLAAVMTFLREHGHTAVVALVPDTLTWPADPTTRVRRQVAPPTLASIGLRLDVLDLSGSATPAAATAAGR